MSKKMAGIILAYGVVVGALGLAVRSVAPEAAKITFITGIAGGGLCVLWGMLGLAGHKRRTWTILTILAVLILLLPQMIQGWVAGRNQPGTNLGAVLVTVLLLLTIGMLLYLLHGERPPEFYTPGTEKRDNPLSRGNNPHSGGEKPQAKSAL